MEKREEDQRKTEMLLLVRGQSRDGTRNMQTHSHAIRNTTLRDQALWLCYSITTMERLKDYKISSRVWALLQYHNNGEIERFISFVTCLAVQNEASALP